MNKNNFDIRRLEKVFNNMVETMDESKKDIFKISEDSRKTYEELKMELEIVQAEVTRMIDSSDALEEETQRARRHLAKVSQEFDRHTERELKEAYEVANELLVRLSINR
ncbi:MAG TPA: histidine kinase, partial [Savagea sp.]